MNEDFGQNVKERLKIWEDADLRWEQRKLEIKERHLRQDAPLNLLGMILMLIVSIIFFLISEYFFFIFSVIMCLYFLKVAIIGFSLKNKNKHV